MPGTPPLIYCCLTLRADSSFKLKFDAHGQVVNEGKYNISDLEDELAASITNGSTEFSRLHVLGGQHTVAALQTLLKENPDMYRHYCQVQCVIIAFPPPMSAQDTDDALIVSTAHTEVTSSSVRYSLVSRLSINRVFIVLIAHLAGLHAGNVECCVLRLRPPEVDLESLRRLEISSFIG